MKERTIAAGFFDGVHPGHRRILEGADAALTFANHPATILSPASAPPMLMGARERIDAIRECGVKEVVALEFTRELAGMDARDFVRRYFSGFGRVRCGANWRFGAGAQGDTRLLQSMGFETEVVPFAMFEGRPVSSTRIREALSAGRVEEAAAMLSRPWAATGRRLRGKGLGRALGFPTVNLALPPDVPPLPFGVYAVEAAGLRAVANFGLAPTAGADAWKTPVLEVNFPENPGETPVEMRVSFLRFIRPERKFASFAELSRQIAIDREKALGRQAVKAFA